MHVQDIGDSLANRAAFRRGRTDAMANYEHERCQKRVCNQSLTGWGQFLCALPAVWDQSENRLQVEGTSARRWIERAGRTQPTASVQSAPAERSDDVRVDSPQTAPSAVGAEEAMHALRSAERHLSQHQQLSKSPRQSRAHPTSAPASASADESADSGHRSDGPKPGVDGGLQRLV